MSGIPSPLGALLSEGQRRLVGAALATLAFALLGALVVGGFYLLGRLVSTFSGVLWPLAVAGITALILRPLVEALEHRFGGRRLAAVLVVAGLLILAFTGFLLLIVPPAVDQILAFIAFVPELWRDASEFLRAKYPEWSVVIQHRLENPQIKALVDQAASELQGLFRHAIPSLKAAGTGVLGALSFATHLAVVPIYLFFFLLSRGQPIDRLGEQLTFLRPELRNDLLFLVREFVGIIVSFFRGQLLIGVIMGLLYAVGFTLVGLKFGALIGMILGLLNIIPYLGTILGFAITVPLAFFQPEGGWRLVLFVLGVKVVVQNIEGWILTPKIMSERTGLHPVMVIVAIFFWGTAFEGLLGMVLAIPLTAFFVTVWRLAKHKYLPVESAARGRST
jgi:predicted PurR-regulated permease PerM